MTHTCTLCNFTTHFESALMMHRQLHHESTKAKILDKCGQSKSKTDQLVRSSDSTISFRYDKLFKGPPRTSSATRLFDKLRSRICRSKTMISPENDVTSNTAFSDLVLHENSMDLSSECTSKDLKVENIAPSCVETSVLPPLPVPPVKEPENFSCHLCNFDADRITVLDRHLLNDHKIGLENLLTLVMAKTKDGLEESSNLPRKLSNVRQPYYKNVLKIMDEEFVIETVVPKVKIMKHAAVNTDLKWDDIPDLKDNCQKLTKELETLIKRSPEQCDKEHFMEKMQTLNEYMCKFMDTSNTLKRALTEFGSRQSIRDRLTVEQPFFDLNMAERDSPNSDWEMPRSEKSERNRLRVDKKLVADSLYF